MTKSKAKSPKQKETESSTDLLERWLQHDNESFHYFDKKEAVEIRSSLLKWYHAHRRKLPWRGDPPPWNGSTSTYQQKNKKTSGDPSTKQGTLDGFVTVKKKKKASDCEDSDVGPLEYEHEPTFPVTGYGVWVSEIMLQQTRVEAVVPFWVRWMKAFPTVQDLAAATEEQVNSHWAGLGFYRRARLLHEAAQYVVRERNAILPKTVEELKKLPGVGPYTASAIASIAFNVTVPVVDGNVCRVLSRLRGIAQTVKAPALKDKLGWTLAAQIVQADGGHNAGDVNQALMELGATYCAPSGSGIDVDDPLRDFYWSTRLGREVLVAQSSGGQLLEHSSKGASSTCPVCAPSGVAQAVDTLICSMAEALETQTESQEVAAKKCGHQAFPLSPPKTAKREEVLAIAAVSHRDHADNELWLMTRRPKVGLLSGQWEFPAALVWTSDSETKGKSKGKRKDMSDQVPKVALAVRKRALNSLLKEIADAIPGSRCQRSLLEVKRVQVSDDEPTEHIFSHVRHTMWIEYGHCSSRISDSTDDDADVVTEQWIDSKGREVRWMSAVDMETVGVTSGVKKILKAVKGSPGFGALKRQKR